LIDASGFVSVIYKGPLSIDALLADKQHSEGTRRERWIRAAPIPGSAIESESIEKTMARLDANLFYHHAVHQESLRADDLAAHYYREALRNEPDSVRSHHGIGNLYARAEQWPEALSHFETWIKLEPENPTARYAAALCHQRLNQVEQARRRLEETIELSSDHVPAHHALGAMDLSVKNPRGAIGHFRAVLKVAPQHASARNNLAWILATNSDDALRDGEQALELAGGLVDDDGEKTPLFLDTLSAAQAEVGRFEDALTTGRKALKLARTAGDANTAAQIERHLANYQAQRAIRE
jgi:tetratricopeptide (TPR) repeat protein